MALQSEQWAMLIGYEITQKVISHTSRRTKISLWRADVVEMQEKKSWNAP